MIIDQFTNIKISKKNDEWLKSKGYQFNIGDTITIKTDDISPGSHIEIKVKCDVCDEEKELMFQSYIKNIKKCGFYACSSKCAQEKVKRTSLEKFGTEYYTQTEEYKERVEKTCLEKYGVEHHTQSDVVKEKIKQTCLEKYGTEYSLQNKEVIEKRKQTNIEKYGYENTFQVEKFKEKIKKTCLEKYGVEVSSKNEEVKEKGKQTCLERYGVDCYSKSDEYKERYKKICMEKYGVENTFQMKSTIEKIRQIILNKTPEEKENILRRRIESYKKSIISRYNLNDINLIEVKDHIYSIKCKKCNQIFDIDSGLLYNRLRYKTILCTHCNPIDKNVSGKEIQLLNFIKENYYDQIIENCRSIIKPLELDIYLPELNLAFEFNGLYWHNEINKPNNYHKDKSDMCQEKRIQLIHVWEDDWMYKQDIVKSMILNKLGKTSNKIMARKCEVKEIGYQETKQFLETNHINGFINSKIKIGLFYQGELISIMCFKEYKNQFNLIRFCDKLNTQVIDSSKVLFNYFINNYNPQEVFSYVDRSYYQNCYAEMGFKIIEKINPDYSYVFDGIRLHKINFRKELLVQEGYDPLKSEHDIMLERGIFRIYDSGKIKFKYIKRKECSSELHSLTDPKVSGH